VFRALADASRGRGITDGLDPDVFATASEMIAVSFDASQYLEQKLFALTAHRAAFGVTPEMLKNPPPGWRRCYRRFARCWSVRYSCSEGRAVLFHDGRCRISSTDWRRRKLFG
jgi:LmbE family N-acetylglucosaminyl deacetylase